MKGITFTLLLLSLSGCAQVLFEKWDNVESGDVDYPQENPHPKRFVELSITNIDFIEYELRSIYSAPKSNHCRYVTNTLKGATSGFSVSLPTSYNQKLDGTAYTRIVVDKYTPGRCGWQFSALHLVVSKDDWKSAGHTILSNPSNTNYGTRIREILLNKERHTDKSDVVLECKFSLIKKWSESSKTKRRSNGQPCVVNRKWGGIGKVLTYEISDIHVLMKKIDLPICKLIKKC